MVSPFLNWILSFLREGTNKLLRSRFNFLFHKHYCNSLTLSSPNALVNEQSICAQSILKFRILEF